MKKTTRFERGTRSYTMSRIRAVDTEPEMLLRRYLYHHEIRYRLHLKHLPGRPDIAITSSKIAIFVNGCFWHNHGCSKSGKLPSTNSNFWKEKFTRNIARDARNQDLLINLGWKVITVWECQINDDALKQLTDEIFCTSVSADTDES